MDKRQPWDQYFMEIAWKVSERATCNRLKVGCVLVKDKYIIATGYNGSLSGANHCIDVGCLMENGHCIRTIHAEQNAITQCCNHGVSTKGATAYITHFPCLLCTKLLIQAGIERIFFSEPYKIHDYAVELLNSFNIELNQIQA